MLEIESVVVGSIGDELDLECGDQLISINGLSIADLIDYQLYAQGEELVFEVLKKSGEIWELDFERDDDDPLGLEFIHPQPRQCQNHCQFCFVRQLPKGLRSSLYVRDDDYRFSYLYGAYISLTNLGDAEIERIVAQQLSPLYVSVHATDVATRSRLLGRELPAVLPLLKRLIDGGIQLHAQVVLCPTINDGAILARTIEELAALHPGILSLAVVPVGLTGHRHELPVLRSVTAAEARQLLDQIHERQVHYLACHGTRFVFGADELYLKAQLDFPPLEAYEALALVENGVGLLPLFRHEAEEVLAQPASFHGVQATLITGVSAAALLRSFVERFNRHTGAQLSVQVIQNRFFGGGVTVTGLLAGCDIVEQLSGVDLDSVLLIPDVICREGEDVLLDDMTLVQVAEQLDVEIAKVPASPWGILEFVEFMAAAPLP